MTSGSPSPTRWVDVAALGPRERYQLLTSIVVPRPIAWVSTWSASGSANLAPFSFFAALASTPPLVGVSIGARGGTPKDTLVNIRARGAFCVNVVSETFLEAMNATSAEVGPEVDEFVLAGLEAVASEAVDAPFVRGCPAVMECRVRKEVDLDEAPNRLIVAEVVGVLLDALLPSMEGTLVVDPEALRPVGRLSGAAYSLQGAVRLIPRP